MENFDFWMKKFKKMRSGNNKNIIFDNEMVSGPAFRNVFFSRDEISLIELFGERKKKLILTDENIHIFYNHLFKKYPEEKQFFKENVECYIPFWRYFNGWSSNADFRFKKNGPGFIFNTPIKITFKDGKIPLEDKNHKTLNVHFYDSYLASLFFNSFNIIPIEHFYLYQIEQKFKVKLTTNYHDGYLYHYFMDARNSGAKRILLDKKYKFTNMFNMYRYYEFISGLGIKYYSKTSDIKIKDPNTQNIDETLYKDICKMLNEEYSYLRDIKYKNKKIKYLVHSTTKENYSQILKDGKIKFCTDKKHSGGSPGVYTVAIKEGEKTGWEGQVDIYLKSEILNDLSWFYNNSFAYGYDREHSLLKGDKKIKFETSGEVVFLENVDLDKYLFKIDF